MPADEILVAGGGAVGLTAAALLKAAVPDYRVVVLDAGPVPQFDVQADVGVRVSAIALGSVCLLEDLRVWPRVLASRASPYRAMRVWDASSGADSPDALSFDAADFAIGELGYIVENELLRSCLYARCREAGVELRFESPIRALVPRTSGDGYRVSLETGEEFAPELLIGADGGASLVRRSAGIASKAWRYPQSALVTHVNCERDHRETAWQRFLPNGPLALLPLADGRCSVVWSDAPDRVAAALSSSQTELSRSLTDASDGVLGKLEVAGGCASFPLRAQHAARYVEAGLALIGDAAHSVHPLAGQGVNLGFADAGALAAAIAAAASRDERPGDTPTLRAFERARRGANAAMLQFTDGINRLFMAKSAPLVGLRRTGMRLFNRSGPIRRRAVQVALGINV